MAETQPPTPFDEKLAQANTRATEQFGFIRTMVEFDKATQLDATFFSPSDCEYAGHYSDGTALISTSNKPECLDPTQHSTGNPFIFDRFNVIQKKIHEVEITLCNDKVGRVAKFLVSKVIKTDAHDKITKETNYLDHLVVEAVEPERHN
jgi:hypothetical protein